MNLWRLGRLGGVKKSRKIAEGLPSEAAPGETVIILDFEGMQSPSIPSFSKRFKNLALI